MDLDVSFFSDSEELSSLSEESDEVVEAAFLGATFFTAAALGFSSSDSEDEESEDSSDEDSFALAAAFEGDCRCNC